MLKYSYTKQNSIEDLKKKKHIQLKLLLKVAAFARKYLVLGLICM